MSIPARTPSPGQCQWWLRVLAKGIYISQLESTIRGSDNTTFYRRRRPCYRWLSATSQARVLIHCMANPSPHQQVCVCVFRVACGEADTSRPDKLEKACRTLSSFFVFDHQRVSGDSCQQRRITHHRLDKQPSGVCRKGGIHD